jgi:F-type H+-transporting ATPase subunit delta
MAESTTIARPYAKAAFEYAHADNASAAWSQFLQTAAMVSLDERVQVFLHAPQRTTEQAFELFQGVLAGKLDAGQENFLKILADNQRLPVLVDIAAIYEHLRAEQEKTITVTVRSFKPLEAAQQDKIAATLRQRLSREIVLENEIDESIGGGFVIQAGDSVFDGSVRSQLAKLANTLAA